MTSPLSNPLSLTSLADDIYPYDEIISDLTMLPSNEEQDDCPICLDRMDNFETGVTLARIEPCHHQFHNDCFVRFATSRASATSNGLRCPCCRGNIENLNALVLNATEATPSAAIGTATHT